MTAASQPPVAKKVPKVHPYVHGNGAPDNYDWLKDQSKTSKSQDILDYITLENEYCQKNVLDPISDLTETVYQEILSRIEESEVALPSFKSPYWYYTRTVEGQQYPIYCRKFETMDAAEEQYLNMNLIKDSEFLNVVSTSVSPSHKLLAYVLDTDGYEHCSIFIKDLESGEMLPDVIPMTSMDGPVWSADNKSLYYVSIDEQNNRPDKLRRHDLGEPASSDVVLFNNEDEKFETSVAKSCSERFIFLTLESTFTTEVYYIDLEAEEPVLGCFCPREFRHRYKVYHRGDYFYILTNGGGQFLNRKLQCVGISDTSRHMWEDVLPYDPYTEIVDMNVFKEFIVVEERLNGLLGLKVLCFQDGVQTFSVPFAEEIYTAVLPWQKQVPYDSDSFLFIYTSFLTPYKTIEFNVKTKQSKVVKEKKVPSGFDPSLYTMRRVFVPIPENTRVSAPFDTPVSDKIPVTLLYRTDLLKRDNTNALHMTAYGCYGYPLEVAFEGKFLSLVDRGIVFAMAHVRGGGDLGQAWYETGKLNYKKNTFSDFVACAEFLVNEEKLTQHHLMSMQGMSAGGLLMGAVMNLKPDIACAVVAAVPWVDVLNSSMDPSIPLTTVEWEEIGNPNEKEAFDYLFSYSPYENIRENVKYPNILVTTGLMDSRVPYWEPAKWVAKMRASQTNGGEADPNKSILAMNCVMAGGHGGSSGRYAKLKETAMVYSFLISELEKAQGQNSLAKTRKKVTKTTTTTTTTVSGSKTTTTVKTITEVSCV
ncbi:prolyl oligopeptidase [Chytriomyces cf. hyalinus JEL632]|nr:prolyl oligopeptidase [Chytriomyces cf. hyalinus JEL632]